MTIAEAHGHVALVFRLAREGRQREARQAADVLHTRVLVAVDALGLAKEQSTELLRVALKTVEVV